MKSARISLTVALAACLAACGKPAPQVAEKMDAPVAEETPAALAVCTARVRVVDLAGEPMAGMTPIVTVRANAFDAPVAVGEPTDAEGYGTVTFPGDRDFCLRAWDPAQAFFPNNYYDVLAGGGEVADTMVIVMAAASAVTVQIYLPGGRPAANEQVGLMFYHPVEGPWWPAPGRTDAQGVARFAPVPPGKFMFRLETESGFGVEIPERMLPPGGEAQLGTVLAMPLGASEFGRAAQ